MISINFLTYCMLLVFFFSLWHFVYESILAPTMRFNKRNDLFKIRDRIRNLIISNTLTNQDKDSAQVIDESICIILKKLNILNFITLIKVIRTLEKNRELKKSVEMSENEIGLAVNQDIVDIFKDVCNIVGKIILINNGAWIIYIIPAIIVWAVFSVLKFLVSKLVVSIPRQDIEKLMPDPI